MGHTATQLEPLFNLTLEDAAEAIEKELDDAIIVEIVGREIVLVRSYGQYSVDSETGFDYREDGDAQTTMRIEGSAVIWKRTGDYVDDAQGIEIIEDDTCAHDYLISIGAIAAEIAPDADYYEKLQGAW